MSLLTRFSLNKIPIIIMLAVLIVIGGITAATSLKSELLPNIDFPLVSVVAIYPGASPDDVRRDVSEPIEKAIAGTANLKTLTSRSNDSVAFVTAEYEYGTDMEKTQKAIEDAVNRITFPTQVQRPTVGRFSLGDVPVLAYSIHTTETGQDALYNLKKNVNAEIVPELQAIPGVNNVVVAGGDERNVVITFDQQKLAENGLTAQTVTGILQANNLSFPTGEIITNNQSIPVRVTHQFESVDDLKQIIVGYKMPALPPGVVPGGATGATGVPSVPSATGAAPGGTTGTAPGTTGGPAQGQPQTGPATTPGATTNPQTKPQTGTTAATPGTTANPQSQPQTGSTAATPGTAANPQSQPQTGTTGGVQGQPGTTGGAQVPTAPMEPPKPVTLGDVATVELTNTQAESINRTNGEPSLGVILYKTQNGNTVQVSDAANAKIDELIKKVPGASKEVQFDSATFVKDSLNGLIREGVLGAILAIVVILLFLTSIRSTLVTALSIPMSILIAFIVLNFFNISLNIMSLAGLAVAVGRVVDDSIVVLENIYRHHFQNREPIREAAFNGTREVATAITSSTITTVSVFLPLGFIAGLVSQFFQSFAIAVSVALLASLVVALTLVPVLAALLIGTNLATYKGDKHEKDTLVQRAYTPTIGLALRNGWTKAGTLALALLLFAGSIVPLATGGIGFSFLSFGSDKIMTGTIKLPPGTDLQTSDSLAKKVEDQLKGNPAIQTYQTTIGSNTSAAATGFFALGNNSTVDLSVTLKPEANLDKEAEAFRQIIKNTPGVDDFTVTTGSGVGPNSTGYSVVVSGSDYDDVLKTANALTDKLKAIPDLVNVGNDASTAKPEIRVLVDPAKALQHGSTTIQIATQLRSLLSQNKVTSITIGGQGYDVLASYDPTTVNSIDKIKQIKVGTVNPVALGEIATVEQADGPVSITRVNQERSITVNGTITSKSTTGVTLAAQDAINSLVNADTGLTAGGSQIAIAGVSALQTTAFTQMGTAIVISVALVYMVMVLTFGSLSTPFVILFSLPLAAIGSLFALWITGQPLGVSALIGVLMLVGIVVTNAIVLLDLVEQLKHKGLSTHDALIQGGRTRVRPILMTAIATIIALIPLAAGGESGSLIASELGIVVIGGLFSSTMLTLIVVPVIYSLLDSLRGRFTRRPTGPAVDTTGADGPGPDDEEALVGSPNGHADEPTPERVPVGAEA
jgi:HAE1 family hydrophobic/amphiphilic exporter-1